MRYPTIQDVSSEMQKRPLFWAAFLCQQTHHERLFMIWRLLKVIMHHLPDGSKYLNKTAEASKECFSEGVESFLQGRLDSSLKSYTESLARAPTNSIEMALAYANRSAVLMKMERYPECIWDIDRALANGYPQEKVLKLKERKGKCYELQGKWDQALQVYRRAKTEVADSKHVDEKIKRCENEKSTRRRVSLARHVPLCDLPIPVVSSQNQEIQGGVSDALSMVYKPKHGRHYVATKDIYTGQVLMSCDSFASLLYHENMYTHCFACLRRSFTLIPCTNCSCAMFCSDTCWEQNKEAHLGFECQVIAKRIHFVFRDSSLLALKIVAKVGLEETQREYRRFSDYKYHDHRTCSFTDGKAQSNLWSLLNMETNIANRPSEQILNLCLDTCVIVQAMGVSNPEDFLPIVFHLLACTDINSIPICENQSEIPNDQKLCISVGTKLVIAQSFLNHSCVSNSLLCAQGDKSVLYAISYIPRGEQVSLSYGAYFVSHDKNKRKQILRSESHYFYCDCQACAENWDCRGEGLPEYPDYVRKLKFRKFEKAYKKVRRLEQHLSFRYMTKTESDKIAEYLDVMSQIGGKKCNSYAWFYAAYISYIARKGNSYVSKCT